MKPKMLEMPLQTPLKMLDNEAWAPRPPKVQQMQRQRLLLQGRQQLVQRE